MKKIALLHTKNIRIDKRSEKLSGDTSGYSELTEQLLKRGYHVDFIAFKDRFEYNWKEYDLVHFMAYFEYALENRLNDTKHFIKFLKNKGVKMANDCETLLWNIDKIYLNDLRKIGIGIPKTEFITGDKKCLKWAINRFKEQFDLDVVVLKPRIGADGFKVNLIRGENDIEKLQLDPNLAQDWIIQEFMAEVTQNGEISHIYFNGRFDEGYLKVPKKDEFRIQSAFGGTKRLLTGILDSQRMKNFSKRIYSEAEKMLNTKLFYARIDFVLRNDDSLCLMELEVFEPALLIRSEDFCIGSSDRYAEALISAAEN